ncbi:MAG: DNA-binding protein, partial [Prevotella sp.]|nr:DNA-binding protein [Prevotella sp.]
MNNNKKQSEREILEEILQTLTEQKKTLEMIVPNPLRIYNNKEIMELLGVKDKYLKKLRDNG